MKILFWMFMGFDRHATSEHLLSAVVEQLCRAGHTVHLLQQHTGGSLPSIPAYLQQYPITTDAVPYRAAPKGNFVARYLAELIYVRECGKLITHEYDAVFIQSNNVAGFAVRAVRRKLPTVPITFNVQDIFPHNAMYCGSLKKGSLVYPFLAAVQRYGYRHSDRLITISEDMKDTLIGEGVSADKIDVIYNWSYRDEPYDREKLDMSVPKRLFDKGRFHVVYAGNIGIMQNVDILIEAAYALKHRKNIWFYVIGDGLYREKLQQRAQALGIPNLSFIPMQPPEAAPSIYAAADLNIIPLAKDIYKTALPSKTATCLACGQPIIFAIGTESRFGRRMQKEAGCMVVASDQASELAKSIERLIGAGDPASEMEFFQKHMRKSTNSQQYAKAIAGGDRLPNDRA